VSRYATAQPFGGQRASVGRMIVRALPHEFGAQLVGQAIGSISDHDEPCVDLDGQCPAGAFTSTATEADVLGMEPGTWTWPVSARGAP
jgi:hypothetical protein